MAVVRTRVDLRVSVEERRLWDAAAAAAGLSLSDWVRSVCADRARPNPGLPREYALASLDGVDMGAMAARMAAAYRREVRPDPKPGGR